MAILSPLLYNKKIPVIPPLLVDSKFVSNFSEKENLLIFFFINMYTNAKYKCFTTFLYRRIARITSLHVTKEDILLIIKTLDSSTAHGWDNISTKMIKICGESIFVPLKIVSEQFKEKKRNS